MQILRLYFCFITSQMKSLHQNILQLIKFNASIIIRGGTQYNKCDIGYRTEFSRDNVCIDRDNLRMTDNMFTGCNKHDDIYAPPSKNAVSAFEITCKLLSFTWKIFEEISRRSMLFHNKRKYLPYVHTTFYHSNGLTSFYLGARSYQVLLTCLVQLVQYQLRDVSCISHQS